VVASNRLLRVVFPEQANPEGRNQRSSRRAEQHLAASTLDFVTPSRVPATSLELEPLFGNSDIYIAMQTFFGSVTKRGATSVEAPVGRALSIS
jgi:hypothetical protein